MRPRLFTVLGSIAALLVGALTGCPQTEVIEDTGPAALELQAECVAVARDADAPEGETRILATVRAQGPDYEVVHAAAVETAALWPYRKLYSDQALATLRDTAEWKAAMAQHVTERGEATWTDADPGEYQAASGYLDAMFAVDVDALADWMDARDLEPRVAEVPIERTRPRVTVIPLGENDEYLTGSALDTEMSVASTVLMAAFRDRGAMVVDFSKEIEAVRQVIDNATDDYGIDEVTLIPADIAIFYRVTPLPNGQYRISTRTVFAPTGELLGQLEGESESGPSAGERLHTACQNVADASWDHIDRQWLGEVDRGRLFILYVQTGGDPAATVAVFDAACALANAAQLVEIDEERLSLFVWVSDELADAHQVYRALRAGCEERDYAIGSLHLTTRHVVAAVR